MLRGKKRVSVKESGSTNGDLKNWFIYGKIGSPKWRYISSHHGPPTNAVVTIPVRPKLTSADKRLPPGRGCATSSAAPAARQYGTVVSFRPAAMPSNTP